MPIPGSRHRFCFTNVNAFHHKADGMQMARRHMVPVSWHCALTLLREKSFLQDARTIALNQHIEDG